jgi:hypothetical protein
VSVDADVIRCEFCGATGGLDSSASYRNVGRRNQGAMTPQWAPAEYSPTLGAVCRPKCFKRRFYAATSKSPQWPKKEAPRR